MKKLSINETKKVKAGKGLTGSFLTGIGSIIKAAGNFVVDTISTIATTVYMFTNKNHSKETIKLGQNSIQYDDEKINALKIQKEIEAEKNQIQKNEKESKHNNENNHNQEENHITLVSHNVENLEETQDFNDFDLMHSSLQSSDLELHPTNSYHEHHELF